MGVASSANIFYFYTNIQNDEAVERKFHHFPTNNKKKLISLDMTTWTFAGIVKRPDSQNRPAPFSAPWNYSNTHKIIQNNKNIIVFKDHTIPGLAV